MSARNVEKLASTAALEAFPNAPAIGHDGTSLYTKAFGGSAVRQIDDVNLVAPGVVGTLNYVEVALTNAEIKALRATPKQLVAAPGAGKMLVLIRAALLLDFGSNVLTETTDNLGIKFTDGSGVQVSDDIEATGFIDAAADTVVFARPKLDAITAKAGSENKALVLHNTGDGEWGGNAGGDTLMRVKVWYAVLTTGW